MVEASVLSSDKCQFESDGAHHLSLSAFLVRSDQAAEGGVLPMNLVYQPRPDLNAGIPLDLRQSFCFSQNIRCDWRTAIGDTNDGRRRAAAAWKYRQG